MERLQAIIRHDLEFERGVFKSRRKLERKREKQSSVYENIVKEILQYSIERRIGKENDFV